MRRWMCSQCQCVGWLPLLNHRLTPNILLIGALWFPDWLRLGGEVLCYTNGFPLNNVLGSGYPWCYICLSLAQGCMLHHSGWVMEAWSRCCLVWCGAIVGVLAWISGLSLVWLVLLCPPFVGGSGVSSYRGSGASSGSVCLFSTLVIDSGVVLGGCYTGGGTAIIIVVAIFFNVAVFLLPSYVTVISGVGCRRLWVRYSSSWVDVSTD